MAPAKNTSAAAPHRHIPGSDMIGWYGMLAILGAYGLVSFELVAADSVIYQGLNFTGALGLIWIAFHKRATQMVVLNTFWALIALLALGNLFLK
jgi:hypothetical protein